VSDPRDQRDAPSGEHAVELDLFGRPPPEGMKSWSHRRGEPRVFALLWTGYLMAATIIAFAIGGAGGVMSPESLRAGGRVLLLSCLLGAAVLWPITRLSQERPANPLGATARDLIVVIIPMQAVILPQTWLASWPLSVVLAMCALSIAWCVLVGGMLAAAQEGEARVGWSLAIIGVVLLGTLPAIVGALVAPPMNDAPRISWMCSPITGVFEITRERPLTGRSAQVGPAHAGSIAAIAALGVIAWTFAALRRPAA